MKSFILIVAFLYLFLKLRFYKQFNQILIKAGREEQAMLTTLAGVIIVLAIIIDMLTEFFQIIQDFLFM